MRAHHGWTSRAPGRAHLGERPVRAEGCSGGGVAARLDRVARLHRGPRAVAARPVPPAPPAPETRDTGLLRHARQHPLAQPVLVGLEAGIPAVMGRTERDGRAPEGAREAALRLGEPGLSTRLRLGRAVLTPRLG